MKNPLLALSILTSLTAPAAFAHKQGDFLIRGGIATVVPNESSDDVLGLGEFGVSNNTQIGLTFGYMLTDNLSLEILAATPFKHKVSLKGLGDIAEVKQLPPTLMVQYYFGDRNSKIRPYVGAGLNYTTFFSEDFNSTGTEAGLSDLSLDDSWGLAANLGMDYMLNDAWSVGASVWYADISTDVNFKAGTKDVSINTDIDPLIFMLSVGYKF